MTHTLASSDRQDFVQDMMKYLDKLDPQHLETLIDGIEKVEPPRYQLIDGEVVPSLSKVSLSRHAAEHELGNVEYSSQRVLRVKVGLESRGWALRVTKTAPDPGAITIPEGVAIELADAFERKMLAVASRITYINERRNSMYDLVSGKGKKAHRVGRAALSIALTEEEEKKANLFKALQFNEPVEPSPAPNSGAPVLIKRPPDEEDTKDSKRLCLEHHDQSLASYAQSLEVIGLAQPAQALRQAEQREAEYIRKQERYNRLHDSAGLVFRVFAAVGSPWKALGDAVARLGADLEELGARESVN